MKKKIIVANWKMNLSLSESERLTRSILKGLIPFKKKLAKVEIVFCPHFTALPLVKNLISRTKIKIGLGAQNVFWEKKGAFTGEISSLMLKEFDCQYVICGHSERREYFKETDEMIHKKVVAVLDSGLIPILCVGEKFDQRQNGAKDYVIIQQVSHALEGVNLDSNQQLIIAYEPVWVIGSGQAVRPQEAEYTHQVIYQRLIDLFPLELVQKNIRIIYGGSVDSSNIKGFLDKKAIDGVLVGGASLKADEFVKIIESSL